MLKDRAALRCDPDRRLLYREAAAAYAAAAGPSRATYPLINAASLSLLAGEPAQATIYASDVLASLEANPEESETPYWRTATRAEALLLLDREAEARVAFGEAIAVAPRAWEDHASTLRQFGLILAEQGRDATWLDAYRPPRSLHFGGHMSFDAKVVRRAHLDERIRKALDEERIGFGYGALAAGADIIIAEALLERGAALHAELPGGVQAFAALSVDPFGKAWRRRFDALLERAETVRAVRPFGAAPDLTMIELGDEIAMGAAAMNARRLESEAVQLLVVADDRHGEEAGLRGRQWGWRQRIVAASRESVPATEPPPLPVARRQRLALLAIAVGAEEDVQERVEALHRLLGKVETPAVPPYFTGRAILLAYGEPGVAARSALLLAQDGAAVGGHYGVAVPVDDPFSGGRRLAGDTAALAEAAAASAPPGSACVTSDFAAALAASRDAGLYAELVGELEAPGTDPVELYALKPRLQ